MPNLASQALGFIGYVEFQMTGGSQRVRATSADIKATQAVDSENVVDGKIDRTTYRLGPIEVGGSISFPAVYEDGSTVTSALWRYCLQRGNDGSLNPITAINVKYADSGAYSYTNNIVDTFEFSVAQSDVVTINIGIIGRARSSFITATQQQVANFYTLRNTRVVTWNDATVAFTGVGLQSNEIRTFSASVNNNSQRFYTLNGQLFPQDVAPTKRDITGSLSIMGRNQQLAQYAFDNQTRCTEPNTLRFGYTVGQGAQVSGTGCNGSFLVELPGIVYQIEEIAITNELLETTVAYRSLPGIAYGVQYNNTDFLLSS